MQLLDTPSAAYYLLTYCCCGSCEVSLSSAVATPPHTHASRDRTARRRRGSGASAGPHRMTRREPPTFPSSAAAGAAPPRSPVLASGCRGRTSRGVTTTMRPTPGTRPRVSTLATPHAWLRSSLPFSAGPPPGSAAIRPRARARTHAHAHAHAHTHPTHAHACSHVCSLLLPCLAFCPVCSPGGYTVLLTHNREPYDPLLYCFNTPPTHNREPYDTLLYCPTSCPYRSVCGTDAACSSNTIRDSISRVAPSQRGPRSAPALPHTYTL
jgi:hypothetical protein